jgi:hypothetical protein
MPGTSPRAQCLPACSLGLAPVVVPVVMVPTIVVADRHRYDARLSS